VRVGVGVDMCGGVELWMSCVPAADNRLLP
jgi:hypothetical protein